MKITKAIKPFATTALALAAIAAISITFSPVQAQNGNGDESKIQQGFAIAPVHLTLAGKNPGLVGLGSYIVNAQASCNSCHDSGPGAEFTLSGNPYLLLPIFSGKKQVNPATYLGGGNDFGAFVPGSAHIVSRNLTPDKTGRPAGRTFTEFRQMLRTGVDLDHLHPTCSGAPNENCIPFPFNGALLQIMPWATFQSMTDLDIEAIYEYLSAIPCIAGPPAPSPLHNDCN